jgi:hypothetical protein
MARETGGNVSYFIPNISGMAPIPVVVDQNMPRNEIWFVNTDRVYMVPMYGSDLALYQSPVNGRTASSMYLYGEYTLVVRNGKEAHAILKNLQAA